MPSYAVHFTGLGSRSLYFRSSLDLGAFRQQLTFDLDRNESLRIESEVGGSLDLDWKRCGSGLYGKRGDLAPAQYVKGPTASLQRSYSRFGTGLFSSGADQIQRPWLGPHSAYHHLGQKPLELSFLAVSGEFCSDIFAFCIRAVGSLADSQFYFLWGPISHEKRALGAVCQSESK